VNRHAPLRLVVPATLLHARAATERIVGLCDRFNTQDRADYATAVMEWLVNVVKHSYAHAPGAEIRICAIAGPEAIELMVEDSGQGMAPWEFDAAPSELDFDATDITKLPESGMGLAIIKSVMDSVRYHSDCGVNRLTALRRWQR
jgi:anti-sigma regulatory factor (Ser/Thr protein kinase)